MMGRRLPIRSGDELDVVCRWPAKWLDRAGARARVKRALRRRERRVVVDTYVEPEPYYHERWEAEDFLGEYPWDEDNV